MEVQGILGYVYNMPRNIAVDDLKNYQADNPATPAEFGVYRLCSWSTGNPYWMLLNDEENREKK